MIGARRIRTCIQHLFFKRYAWQSRRNEPPPENTVSQNITNGWTLTCLVQAKAVDSYQYSKKQYFDIFCNLLLDMLMQPLLIQKASKIWIWIKYRIDQINYSNCRPTIEWSYLKSLYLIVWKWIIILSVLIFISECITVRRLIS